MKRIYVPLPDSNVRKLLFKTKLKCQPHSLSDDDIDKIVKETEGKLYRLIVPADIFSGASQVTDKQNLSLCYTGYSGSDLQALCEEAAMMPIRELGADILTVQANKVLVKS